MVRLAVVSSTLCVVTATGNDPTSDEVEFFESRIRPVLHEHCFSCHSAQAKLVRGGLLLDSAVGLSNGGDTGPAVVPGKPNESLLISALRHEAMEMPPDGRLSDAIIHDFKRWISMGAVDPRDDDPASDKSRMGRISPEASRDHWAFQPLTAPVVPPNENQTWAQNPIDSFVWETLSRKNWAPAEQADKYTLIRRATFDLIGLPPTRQEIESFLADDSPTAFQRVIERLLASPHYGERWGRHWLDLVRYADTNGADENHNMPNAWRYRDWVIRSLNRDLPLTDFITQQLAGDLLPVPDDEEQAGDLITATGMLVVGPKMLAEQDKEKMRIDIIDEQIDTVSRTMLGMTIACARCHDHKFDPITTEDYYALAGIFASTRTMENEEFVSKWMERPLPSSRISLRIEQHRKKVAKEQEHLDQMVERANEQLLRSENRTDLPKVPEKHYDEQTKKTIEALKASIDKLKKATPKHHMAMAVEEKKATDLPVHIRGNHLTKTETPIPRGVPTRLNQVAPLGKIAKSASGRLELARWLTSSSQPLTARVMANRLWMWHFGQPLMRSPSNFGLQASRPLHKDLLDWLAAELLRSDGSLKQIHRRIMLSRTYQMSSRCQSHSQQDPTNEFLWRQNRRRLEVEPLRDAILCAGDAMDRRFEGAPVNDGTARRTVYLSINRAALNELFSTFDYVEPANHIEQRPVTTVPGQALYLLNSQLVHQQAQRIADKFIESTSNPHDRSERLWMHLNGRRPSKQDIQRMSQFIHEAVALAEGDARVKERTAWASLCRTLIAGSGFCYVR